MNNRIRHFYEFGPFRLDTLQRIVLREGEMVHLPPKVFEILQVLVENNGEIVGKEELMRRVWPDSFVEEGNLPVNVFALRKALGSEGNQNQYIKTVPKRGYLFVADVTEGWDESESPVERRDEFLEPLEFRTKSESDQRANQPGLVSSVLLLGLVPLLAFLWVARNRK